MGCDYVKFDNPKQIEDYSHVIFFPYEPISHIDIIITLFDKDTILYIEIYNGITSNRDNTILTQMINYNYYTNYNPSEDSYNFITDINADELELYETEIGSFPSLTINLRKDRLNKFFKGKHVWKLKLLCNYK